MNKIIKALTRHASERPESLAVLSKEYQVTYQELDDWVSRAAGILAKAGISSPSSCALQFSEPLLHVVVSLAVMKNGLAQLSFAPRQDRQSVQEQLDEWQPGIFISDGSPSIDWPKQISLKWDDIYNAEPARDLPDYDVSRPCICISGSGTTGEPRNWQISFEQRDARLLTLLSSAGMQQGERHFSCVEFHFSSGAYRFFTCLINGLCNVFHLDMSKPIEETIQSLEVDHVYGVPMHAQNMLRRYDEKGYQGHLFPKLKSFTLTGSIVSTALQQSVFEKLTDNLTIAYGTNECGGISMAKPDVLKKFPGTIGMPYSDVQVEIVDNNTQVLEPNEVGEIRVKTPGMIFNYGHQKNVRESVPAVKEGWFYPGDLGCQNEEGLLFLKGRKDDLIIHDGINVYPKEVEDVLESHPLVAEAVVYPVELGDASPLVAASVVLKNSFQKGDIKTINDFVKPRLGAKAPKFIMREKDFPRNERGKVLKRELKARLEKRLRAV